MRRWYGNEAPIRDYCQGFWLRDFLAFALGYDFSCTCCSGRPAESSAAALADWGSQGSGILQLPVHKSRHRCLLLLELL